MKFFFRVILFYCCFSLFGADLISFVLKVNDYCIVDSETEKNEENKEDVDDKLEEIYTSNLKFTSFSLFTSLTTEKFSVRNEKLISQAHIEISTPPPNI